MGSLGQSGERASEARSGGHRDDDDDVADEREKAPEFGILACLSLELYTGMTVARARAE